MPYFVSPNTQSNFQHLQARNFLTQSGVETRPALLNESKMKSGCVSDHLDVVRIVEVRVVGWNGFSILDLKGLHKCSPEIRISVAAIADVPACIHSKIGEISETLSRLIGAIRLTAGERSESIEIYRLLALEDQICVEEICVTQLIERVTGDVLRTIGIEELESELIVILCSLSDSTELSILLPQVGLHYFSRSNNFNFATITRREWTGRLRERLLSSQHGTSRHGRSRCESATQKERHC